MKQFLLIVASLFSVLLLSGCSSDFLSESELDDLTPTPNTEFYFVRVYNSNAKSDLNSFHAYDLHSQEEFINLHLCQVVTSQNPDFLDAYKDLPSSFENIDWSKQTLMVISSPRPTIDLQLHLLESKLYSKNGKYYVDLNLKFAGDGMLTAIGEFGYAFIINSPNVSVKDIKVFASGYTQYFWDKNMETIPFKKTFTY